MICAVIKQQCPVMPSAFHKPAFPVERLCPRVVGNHFQVHLLIPDLPGEFLKIPEHRFSNAQIP